MRQCAPHRYIFVEFVHLPIIHAELRIWQRPLIVFRFTIDIREETGLRPGGYGLAMTRSLVDELIYNEARNEVICIKYLDQPGGES